MPATGKKYIQLLQAFFTDERVDNPEAAFRARVDLFTPYFPSMLEQGIYLAPSTYDPFGILNEPVN